MKILRSAGAIAAGSMLALGLMTSSASADAAHIENATDVSGAPPSSARCTPVYPDSHSLIAGEACFESYGDYFWVRDWRADGHHIEVRATYRGNPATLFICKDYKGEVAGWTRCSFHNEMTEDQRINYVTMLMEGNSILAKGPTISSVS